MPPQRRSAMTGAIAGLDRAPTWADLGELDRFEAAVTRFAAGELDPEAFRRLRIWHGVYSQRQRTDVYMLRVKIPGGALSVEALEALAEVAELYSRGWGHITTRQNVEFHFVALSNVLPALRRLAVAGLTSRESGGDTVRNVTACPLAGVCRSEVFDVSGAAEALARHFLRNPLTQNLARKFKIAVSGCTVDCALAVVQDVGVVAAEESGRTGYRLLLGGGLGTDPRLAAELEPLTDPGDLIITVEAILRVWDRENLDRSRRTRVRVRHLVARLGLATVREKIFAEREKLRCSATIPDGPPQAALPERVPQPPPLPLDEPFKDPELPGLAAWRERCLVEQRGGDRYAVYATARLGDVTAPQLRTLDAAARSFGITWRTTVRQNLVARDIDPVELPRLYDLLHHAGLDAGGEHSVTSIVSCPGLETCGSALTASREVAATTIDALRAAGLADVTLSVSVSGCTNSCAQQQLANIGLSGLVRRIGADEVPGFRILLGGRSGVEGTALGRYVAKVLASRVPGVVVTLVRRYLGERHSGEDFPSWVERVGPEVLGSWLEEVSDGADRT